jgi:hypothetical protein
MARRRHSSRRHRGGAGYPNPSSYSSGAGYGVAVNGPTVEGQFDRTFMGNGPANYRGVQGQMTGGRKSRRRRGGFLGEVINQAIVPFGILGMQQTYRKKRHGGRKTRRHRR